MQRTNFRTHDANGNALPPAALAFKVAQKQRDAIRIRLAKACQNPDAMPGAEYTALQAELQALIAECAALGRAADAAEKKAN